MLITVTWHDPSIRSKIVEVRDRPSKDDYFLGGILNQAMRQAGIPEATIHAQHFVGPVEFVLNEKPAKICIVCETCGSFDIRRDAWAAYNEDTQQWELDATYDDAFCIDCDAACDLLEIEETMPCSPDPV